MALGQVTWEMKKSTCILMECRWTFSSNQTNKQKQTAIMRRILQVDDGGKAPLFLF